MYKHTHTRKWHTFSLPLAKIPALLIIRLGRTHLSRNVWPNWPAEWTGWPFHYLTKREHENERHVFQWAAHIQHACNPAFSLARALLITSNWPRQLAAGAHGGVWVHWEGGSADHAVTSLLFFFIYLCSAPGNCNRTGDTGRKGQSGAQRWNQLTFDPWDLCHTTQETDWLNSDGKQVVLKEKEAAEVKSDQRLLIFQNERNFYFPPSAQFSHWILHHRSKHRSSAETLHSSSDTTHSAESLHTQKEAL